MANSSDPGGQRNTAFILGAVVVAVLVLGYFVFGGSAPEPTAGGDTGNTTVNIDNSAPAEPVEPAPAEPAAPADGTAPATGGTTQGN